MLAPPIYHRLLLPSLCREGLGVGLVGGGSSGGGYSASWVFVFISSLSSPSRRSCAPRSGRGRARKVCGRRWNSIPRVQPHDLMSVAAEWLSIPDVHRLCRTHFSRHPHHRQSLWQHSLYQYRAMHRTRCLHTFSRNNRYGRR